MTLATTQTIFSLPIQDTGLDYHPISSSFYAYSRLVIHGGSDCLSGRDLFTQLDIPSKIAEQISAVLGPNGAGCLYEIWAESGTPTVVGYVLTDEERKKVLRDWAVINMPAAKRDARIPLPVDFTVQKHNSTVPIPKRASDNRAVKSD